MPRPRDPFLAALDALRRGLREGAFPPGRAIVIADAARGLRLSTTPVREALACLSGEGLLEVGPAGGYVAPRLDAADIAERYALNAIYLTAALRIAAAADAGAGRDGSAATGGPTPTTALPLFDRLMLGSANRTLNMAYARLRQQLGVVQRVETDLFHDLSAEAAGLEALEARADWPGLSEAIAAYHARRLAAVGSIMVSLHAGASAANGVDR